MKPKIQGTEHEYTLYCKKMGGMGFDPHAIALDLLRQSTLHLAGEFIKNGSRCYYDVGHFEVSTAEVTNPYDLVIWEKAGEKILDWLRKVMEEKYTTSDTRIWAFKNNTSPDGTSYGSHENYCMSRDLKFPDRYVEGLVPHLTTRIIYTGSGDILDGKYVLSPSAYLTSRVVSGDTMHDTGVLNTRDEPHGRGVRRLHLQVGDALMNETAILLRHFTTTAILHLMEEGRLADVPRLEDPIKDLWHNVEETNPEKWQITLKGGKKSTPMEIQRYYLAKVESLIESPKEKKAFRLWEEVLEGLEKKSSKKLARRVEWLDRWFAIKEGKETRQDAEAEMMACKQYSEIGEDRGIFYRRQKSGLIDRVTTDEEILHAISEPPQDTRARLRRELGDKLHVESIDWSYVVVSNGARRRIELEDPYQFEMEVEHAPEAG